MPRRTTICRALAGFAVLACAPLAGAETVTATLDGIPLIRYVDFSLNNVTYSGAWTGQIDWRLAAEPPTPLHTFCIEITQDISPGATYTYQVAKLEDAPELAGGRADALRELWGRHYAQVTDADTSAAFQLAVWEIVSDTGRNLDDGNFRVLHPASDPPAYYSIAQDWLNSLDGRGPRASLVAFLDPIVQDQITAIPLPPASAGGLLLLAGLGAYRIRRRA